eukprot:15456588-Alexandrium_andersonii.AAC.1
MFPCSSYRARIYCHMRASSPKHCAVEHDCPRSLTCSVTRHGAGRLTRARQRDKIRGSTANAAL